MNKKNKRLLNDIVCILERCIVTQIELPFGVDYAEHISYLAVDDKTMNKILRLILSLDTRDLRNHIILEEI